MNTNPLLNEIWEIKDRLSAEAGNDVHVFCEQLRTWEVDHLSTNPRLHTPQELRSLLAGKQEQLAIHEAPPLYGTPCQKPNSQSER